MRALNYIIAAGGVAACLAVPVHFILVATAVLGQVH